MILVRILVGILSIPLIIIAFVLQLFLKLVVMLGGKLVIAISSLIFLGGLIFLGIDLFGGGSESTGLPLPMIIVGLVGYSLPYIAIYVIAFLQTFISKVKSYVFGR
ncbi:MAG: hypothetical protein IJF39_00695 [Clostridia bacterium]|nr:hypothetical protein [Clostridia bacterium]